MCRTIQPPVLLDKERYMDYRIPNNSAIGFVVLRDSRDRPIQPFGMKTLKDAL